MLNWWAGKKTYVVAVLTGLGAVGAWLQGSIDFDALLHAIQVSLVAMGLRSGISAIK